MAKQSDPKFSGGNLGVVASAGMADVEAGAVVQESLEGMEFANTVKFVGMGYKTNESDFKLGEEYTFTVRARCTGVGDELMRDEHTRHIIKMDVLATTVPETSNS